jgi:hypothetical protein
MGGTRIVLDERSIGESPRRVPYRPKRALVPTRGRSG